MPHCPKDPLAESQGPQPLLRAFAGVEKACAVVDYSSDAQIAHAAVMNQGAPSAKTG
jgi:hypothetical protein